MWARFLPGGQPPGHEVICARASAKRIKSGRRRHLQLWRARPTISPVASDDVTRAGHLRTGRSPNCGELEAPWRKLLRLADACRREVPAGGQPPGHEGLKTQSRRRLGVPKKNGNVDVPLVTPLLAPADSPDPCCDVGDHYSTSLVVDVIRQRSQRVFVNGKISSWQLLTSGETVGVVDCFGIVLNVAGVAVVTYGLITENTSSTQLLTVSVLLPFAATFCKAPSVVIARSLVGVQKVSILTVMFYANLPGTVVRLGLTYWFETPIWAMSAQTVGYVIGLCLCGCGAHFATKLSLKTEKAGITATIKTFTIPLAVLLDYVVLSELPSLAVLTQYYWATTGFMMRVYKVVRNKLLNPG
ncbi:hypothetical protein Bbelb_252950 [Branchiostoma belcheri]|nr:hypothetical protein Bbelb_252950 [Branchiostoma belcheri]